MSVVRIFEWHYLYHFLMNVLFTLRHQSISSTKTSFLTVVLEPGLIYLYKCLLAFFYVPGIILGTWDTLVNKQGRKKSLPSGWLQILLFPGVCNFSPLTPLLVNILYMLMISEDLLTFVFLILFPYITLLAFNCFLCVVVALNFISCYLSSLYYIPVPWAKCLHKSILVIAVSPHRYHVLI